MSYYLRQNKRAEGTAAKSVIIIHLCCEKSLIFLIESGGILNPENTKFNIFIKTFIGFRSQQGKNMNITKNKFGKS